MIAKIALVLAAMTAAGAAQAEDPLSDTEGYDVFKKRCRACHTVAADDGTVLFKGGRTGPNLYGVIGRTAGSEEDYRYRDDIVAAGEQGLVWDEDSFEAYVQDPTGFLKEYLDDSGARSGMTFKLRDGGVAVYEYLRDVSADAAG